MRLKLASDLENRDGTVSKDAGLNNAMVEKEGEWSSSVIKRPGSSSLGSVGSGSAQMLSSLEDTVTAVLGNDFKTITVSTSATVDASTSMNPIFPDLPFDHQIQPGNSGKMVIKTAKEAWIYTP